MGMPTAQSVMTDSVLTVSPESPLLSVLQLFVEEEIHGAPVVDEDHTLLGVITTTDILRAQEQEHNTVAAESDYQRSSLEFSAPDGSYGLVDFQDRLAQRTAADVMTKGVISLSRDAPIREVARCLRKNQIHRVWIEDEGKLVGVVSALDLIAVVEREDGAK